jgi:hypothetical protein
MEWWRQNVQQKHYIEMTRPGDFTPPPAGDRAYGTGLDPAEKKKMFALLGDEFWSSGPPVVLPVA